MYEMQLLGKSISFPRFNQVGSAISGSFKILQPLSAERTQLPI
jgi:hypothetical protein